MEKGKEVVRAAFYSVPLSEEQNEKATELRDCFANMADAVMACCPPGRYRSIVITDLEKCAAMATKSIAHEWPGSAAKYCPKDECSPVITE